LKKRSWSCPAFPEKIPEKIMKGALDHDKIIPGQKTLITYKRGKHGGG
jgi:hypothetical protein